MIDRDIEKVARNIVARWTHAEVEYGKKVSEGKDAKWNKAGSEFYGDDEFCSLETMINELKMKEFQAQCEVGKM